MFNPDWNEALRQLQDVRRRCSRQQLFVGYSSQARLGGGVIALLVAAVLGWLINSSDPWVHVWAWGLVFAAALGLNATAVLLWYARMDESRRRWEKIQPLYDVLPILLVGAILTAALLWRENFDLLFGVWMCLFGLVHFASRYSQSREIVYVGWYYLAAGALLLTADEAFPFTNPWPMGLVFFVGETVGSLVFAYNRTQVPEED